MDSLDADQYQFPRAYHHAMTAITSAEAQAYLDRWKLVHELEVEQLQRTSMETKLHQLAALVCARQLFGPQADRAGDEQIVRER